MTLLRYLISLIKIYQVTLLGKLISHTIAVRAALFSHYTINFELSNLCRVLLFFFSCG